MLYLNIKKTCHDFLDAHKYRLPLSTVDDIDAKIAETIALWVGDKPKKLYDDTFARISEEPEEFAGQIIDILEDALTNDPDFASEHDNSEAIITGEDYDKLAAAIKNEDITSDIFSWIFVAPAVPTPASADELRSLQLGMMAKTIENQSKADAQTAAQIVDKYADAVRRFGTPLLPEEAEYAICGVLEGDDGHQPTSADELLSMSPRGFLNMVHFWARDSINSAFEMLNDDLSQSYESF